MRADSQDDVGPVKAAIGPMKMAGPDHNRGQAGLKPAATTTLAVSIFIVVTA